MKDLFFGPAKPASSEEMDAREGYVPSGCTCTEPDFALSLEEGSICFRCRLCGEGEPDSWGDWRDVVTMDEIPVKVSWEKDPCTCTSRTDMINCHCDYYLVVTPTQGAAEGEEKK